MTIDLFLALYSTLGFSIPLSRPCLVQSALCLSKSQGENRQVMTIDSVHDENHEKRWKQDPWRFSKVFMTIFCSLPNLLQQLQRLFQIALPDFSRRTSLTSLRPLPASVWFFLCNAAYESCLAFLYLFSAFGTLPKSQSSIQSSHLPKPPNHHVLCLAWIFCNAGAVSSLASTWPQIVWGTETVQTSFKQKHPSNKAFFGGDIHCSGDPLVDFRVSFGVLGPLVIALKCSPQWSQGLCEKLRIHKKKFKASKSLQFWDVQWLFCKHVPKCCLRVILLK